MSMSTMRPADVNWWRGIAVWTLRVVSVVLCSIGLYLALKKVLFGLGVGQLEMIWSVWEGVGEEHSLYRGVSMLAVGGLLGVAAKPLSRWAIALPPATCPGCGYQANDPAAASTRCPECGLDGVKPSPGLSP